MLIKNPKVAVRPLRNMAMVRVLGTEPENYGGMSGTLNETAFLLWTCLDYTTDLSVIAKTLSANYSVPFETTYQDAKAMLESFLNSHLLLETDHEPPGTPNPDAEPLDLRTSSLFLTYQGPIITKAGFVVTSKCNCDCRHCYVDKTRDDRMTLQDWVKVLYELKDMGCSEIMFIGGEPFMQPWLCDLLEIAEAEGFVYYVDTNGFLITDEIIARLQQLQHLMYIDISVYGLRSETLRQVIRRDLAPEQILLTIRKLMDAGVKTYAKFVPMRSNLQDLPLIPEFNCQYGIKLNHKYVPMHSSQDQLRGLDENIPLETLKELLDQNWVTVATSGSARSHCSPARCSINSDGSVSICENNIQPRGNLLQESIVEIWTRLGRSWQEPQTNGICQACTVHPYCPRCDGISYMETGCVSSPVPYLCEFAQTMQEYFAKKGDSR